MHQTFTAAFRENALYLTLSAARRLNIVLFTMAWICGWSLTVTVAALDIIRHSDMELEQNALLLGLWLLAGIIVGFVLLWMSMGQQEVLHVDADRIEIQRRAGIFRWTRSIDVSAIRSIKSRPAIPRHPFAVAEVVRFWRGDLGRVTIDGSRRRDSVGEGLSDAEAAQIVTLLHARLPHVEANPLVDRSTWTRTRLAVAASAFIAAMMAWPAMTIPLRLAIIDRSICFADDSVPPAHPAELKRPTDRSLHLVALDGIEVERLEAIAQQFQSRYGVRVAVHRSTASVEAYDPQRRQVNAAAALKALDQVYPGAAVVIAVTDRDMYIPGFGWRYAFSYRQKQRLAVVSTARMERGCLGLFAASEARQAARLRKMMAKNVGVLYFGLPVSDDPRSVLYAYVGGPQELDVMSEVF
jgi:predicted Zn-dependent protease